MILGCSHNLVECGDVAVDGAVLAKMRNNGQSCIVANRFYVQDGIAEAFTGAFVQRPEALEIGGATDNPDVPTNSPVLSNEILGPVAPIVRFSAEDDAVKLANDTELGLASYILTENLDGALRMIDRLDVGMVGVNQRIVSNPAAYGRAAWTAAIRASIEQVRK